MLFCLLLSGNFHWGLFFRKSFQRKKLFISKTQASCDCSTSADLHTHTHSHTHTRTLLRVILFIALAMTAALLLTLTHFTRTVGHASLSKHPHTHPLIFENCFAYPTSPLSLTHTHCTQVAQAHTLSLSASGESFTFWFFHVSLFTRHFFSYFSCLLLVFQQVHNFFLRLDFSQK